ncbi:hypothetical protein ANN_21002 [Periplaneta americana]|uniref:ERAP1-like C-terminal domain-containing protein n=1 Tax=Periplaneta americana TaxID=6978 RepID=A0ABQ8SEL0_PERAM|nr:hypothetical protein ANN_21002 [Periplaneta americana]
MPGIRKQQHIFHENLIIGMFMVNYDPQNWNLLSDYLQSGTSPEIPALTRAKLLHDAWNIGYSGELDMTTALDLTLFLPHEKNSAVWSPFLNLVDHIHRLISGTSVEPKFVHVLFTQRKLTVVDAVNELNIEDSSLLRAAKFLISD